MVALRANATAPSTNTVVIPATTQVGDLIVLRASMYYVQSAIVVPTDFTIIVNKVMSGGNYAWCAVAWKIAVVSDAGRSVAISSYSPYPEYSTYSCHVFSGVDSTTPIAAFSSVGSSGDSNTLTTGALTVGQSGQVVLLFSAMMYGLSSANQPDPPGGQFTRLYDSPVNSSTNWHLGTMSLSTTGVAVGSPSWSTTWQSAGPNIGVALLLRGGLRLVPIVGQGVVTAALSGGLVMPTIRADGRSVVSMGLYRPAYGLVVTGGGSTVDESAPGTVAAKGATRSVGSGAASDEMVAGVFAKAGGGGSVAPPTTGQIWPRGK